MIHPGSDSFIDDSSSLQTGTSLTFQESLESGIINVDQSKDLFEKIKFRSNNSGSRVYRYRKKKPFLNGNFSAPVGVNPYHVASSSARKFAGLNLKIQFCLLISKKKFFFVYRLN